MVSRSHTFFAVVAGLLTLPVLTTPVEAQDDNQGFLYGRVTTESGNEYVGFLRWGTQEGFWDDLFHSTKKDLPFHRYLDRRDVDRRRDRANRGHCRDKPDRHGCPADSRGCQRYSRYPSRRY